MRGYPKGPLRKQDYEKLLVMPEYADQAKADLVKLASIDDSKITVDQGTEVSSKLVKVDNPLPAWKRAGYKSKMSLVAFAQTIDVGLK